MTSITRINPDPWAKSSTTMLNGKLQLYRRGNVAQINFRDYSPGTYTGTKEVCTLPEGYRPPQSAYLDGGGYIEPDGREIFLQARSGTNVWTGANYPVWS